MFQPETRGIGKELHLGRHHAARESDPDEFLGFGRFRLAKQSKVHKKGFGTAISLGLWQSDLQAEGAGLEPATGRAGTRFRVWLLTNSDTLRGSWPNRPKPPGWRQRPVTLNFFTPKFGFVNSKNGKELLTVRSGASPLACIVGTYWLGADTLPSPCRPLIMMCAGMMCAEN